jgi:eukaryotic-like serine/threonine-protein kinase
MNQRRCPKCKSVYTGDARFCPKDGSMLVEVAGGGGQAASTPPPASGKGTAIRQVTPKPGPSVERASSLSNQVLDARYQVLRKLGEGGMSYVYEAKEISSSQSVAIKVLSPRLAADPKSLERLRREAGLAMRLDHPNVCKIYRLGHTEDGLVYLVMPYLKGELLSDREVRDGPMDLATGLRLLGEVCAGLHHAHELQIVHRDLKPENIMLVPDDNGSDTAVVMDFGLAKERRADPAVAKLTETGIILGTPEFMSPEQIRGKQLDARSDIYALGIVAFEMFTGKLPFQGRNAQEMMLARLRGTPIPLRQLRPDLPAKLEKTLARSLETNPEDRFGTSLEFGEALKGSVEGGGGGLFGKILGR